MLQVFPSQRLLGGPLATPDPAEGRCGASPWLPPEHGLAMGAVLHSPAWVGEATEGADTAQGSNAAVCSSDSRAGCSLTSK